MKNYCFTDVTPNFEHRSYEWRVKPTYNEDIAENIVKNIDIDKIEAMINKNTVAILAPNLLGNLCRWDKIFEIAKKYN